MQVVGPFRDSMVNGVVLLTLTEADLERDLHITSKVLRTRVLLDIAQLRLQSSSIATSIAEPLAALRDASTERHGRSNTTALGVSCVVMD